MSVIRRRANHRAAIMATILWLVVAFATASVLRQRAADEGMANAVSNCLKMIDKSQIENCENHTASWYASSLLSARNDAIEWAVLPPLIAWPAFYLFRALWHRIRSGRNGEQHAD